jgi:hypothetical protein
MKNSHLIPAGYFAIMYIDETGTRKWRLYDGPDERGTLVAEGLRDETAIKRKWREYLSTKGMRRRD